MACVADEDTFVMNVNGLRFRATRCKQTDQSSDKVNDKTHNIVKQMDSCQSTNTTQSMDSTQEMVESQLSSKVQDMDLEQGCRAAVQDETQSQIISKVQDNSNTCTTVQIYFGRKTATSQSETSKPVKRVDQQSCEGNGCCTTNKEDYNLYLIPDKNSIEHLGDLNRALKEHDRKNKWKNTKVTPESLYEKLASVGIGSMGMKTLPFTKDDFIEKDTIPGLAGFMLQYARIMDGDHSDARAIEILKDLKINPPAESYESPVLSEEEASEEDQLLMTHIFHFGIDLPGSKHNPFGHLQYYSSFFIDMYFGNYTEFMEHINNFTEEQLAEALLKREGYCQWSPIFAPILGLQMVGIENNNFISPEEKQKIKLMYSLQNENKHLKILKKLIKLGADVNAHDIYGFTGLHYSVLHDNEAMISILCKNGANPNAESRNGLRPLTNMRFYETDKDFRMVDILLERGGFLTNKKHISDLRTHCQAYAKLDITVRVRETMPHGKNECEMCGEFAKMMCAACGHVSYCTSTCQKMDWHFHKPTCYKQRLLKDPAKAREQQQLVESARAMNKLFGFEKPT